MHSGSCIVLRCHALCASTQARPWLIVTDAHTKPSRLMGAHRHTERLPTPPSPLQYQVADSMLLRCKWNMDLHLPDME
eukprot:812668-Pelagomonas_calceolata.AAC.1